jgi:hypothetical protein
LKRVSPNGPENPNTAKGIKARAAYASWIAAQSAFLLAYFTVLPMLAVMILHWGFHTIASASFYASPWTAPALLMLGTFLGGAMIRWRMEREASGLRLFVLAVLALILFAGLTLRDIRHGGEISARLLPMAHNPALHPYALMLPAVGILGMLAYRHFIIGAER